MTCSQRLNRILDLHFKLRRASQPERRRGSEFDGAGKHPEALKVMDGGIMLYWAFQLFRAASFSPVANFSFSKRTCSVPAM